MDLLRQAGRTESVHNGELLNSFQICGTKKGPARRFSCKPLICLVPEPGIEPGRPYERGDFKSLVVALNFFGVCLPGRAPGEGRIASVTFRVTLLLGIQQRWASFQRALVAGVQYLLALSK